MIKILCDVCFKEPSDDFILSGEIFETRIPFDATNLNTQKQMRKTQVHLCKDCFDKFLSKHLNKTK